MESFTTAEIQAIRTQLLAMEVSPVFSNAERMLRFLRYVVEEVIAGRGSRLNQMAIGIEVFDRDESFDPAVDSVVRVEARRFREKLREYYAAEGKHDAVRFELPKGTYELSIRTDSDDIKTATTSQAEIDGIRVYGQPKAATEFARTKPGRFTIAVLPFEPLSRGPTDEELADAITTEIIDELGRAASFEVISRRTSSAFKDRALDAREAGRELDVSYVLEGSLRSADDRVRVSTALVDTSNGLQVWSETYNREQMDVFEFQDDIAHSIVVVLGGVVWRAASEKARLLAPDQLDAAGLAHRAAGTFFHFSRRSFQEGEELARRAIDQYPNSGHGYMLLAFLLAFKAICCWTSRPEHDFEQALAASNRAAELSPDDSWVLALASQALIWIGEPDRGYTLAERAYTLEPDNLVNEARLGDALVHLGKAEEGLAHIENAIVLGSEEHIAPPWHYYFSSFAYSQLGRYEEAEKTGHIMVDLMGDCPLAWIVYANACSENGKPTQAQVALAELLHLSPNMTLKHLEWVYGIAYKSEEIAESHLCGLRKLDWKKV